MNVSKGLQWKTVRHFTRFLLFLVNYPYDRLSLLSAKKYIAPDIVLFRGPLGTASCFVADYHLSIHYIHPRFPRVVASKVASERDCPSVSTRETSRVSRSGPVPVYLLISELLGGILRIRRNQRLLRCVHTRGRLFYELYFHC